MKQALIGAVGVVCVMLSGSVMSAQGDGTPDGAPPANEGVCDVLMDHTPGLYGLCVAYCEAIDADLSAESDPPNSRILDNYRKRMGAGDPDMPCVQDPCPCWSLAEITSIDGISEADGSQIGASCSNSESVFESDGSSDPVQNFQGAQVAFGQNCIYALRIDGVPILGRQQRVTPEEHAVCLAQIVTQCESLGQ